MLVHTVTLRHNILSRTESCVLKYNETSYDSLYITILFFLFPFHGAYRNELFNYYSI